MDSITLNEEYKHATLLKLLGEKITEALKTLTETDIVVQVFGTRTMDIAKIIEKYSRDEPIVAIASSIYGGDIDGQVLLLLDIPVARDLVKLLAQKIELEPSDEDAQDILREFGNIVIGNISSIFSKGYRYRIDYDIPEVVVDLDTAVIDSIVLPIASKHDVIELLEMSISSTSEQLKLRIIMFGVSI
ncbi:MAG: chemotaxis protein CheX [Staphylothermus sp.]|nr:chemotaxis protein CheX [Staphylothermus sp.]